MRSGEAEQALLSSLHDPNASFLDAAHAYRVLCQTQGRYDWETINQAIVDRWEESALSRLRDLAWRKNFSWYA